MRKGGVAGGVKNAESSGKTRFKVVKPGQFLAHFGQNRASLGAFEFVLIESVLESGPKRPLRPEREEPQPLGGKVGWRECSSEWEKA